MGKLNVVLDWFANTNHTGFLLAEKRGYFAEAGLEVHIDGEVHGVMDLHGADFVLGPQISMLDCMSRGVELTGVAVLTQRSDSGIVSLKESGITSPRHLEGKRLTHWAPRWFHGVIGEAVRLDGGDYGKVELVPMDVGDIVATLGTVAAPPGSTPTGRTRSLSRRAKRSTSSTWPTWTPSSTSAPPPSPPPTRFCGTGPPRCGPSWPLWTGAIRRRPAIRRGPSWR